MLRLLLSALLLASLCVPAMAQKPPQKLRCEYLVNPLGIDVSRPRLSWQLADSRRGARQTGFQIRVGSAPGLADIWDSGAVASDQSIHVPYAGPPLRSRTRYHWQVRVWDQNGRPTGWSAPAWWETGILDASEWKARWIGRVENDQASENLADLKWIWFPEGNPHQNAPAGERWFRLGFEVPTGKTVRSATVGVAVDNSASIFINGQNAGEASGWGGLAAHDLTAHLRPGSNTLGIIARNADGPAGLMALLRIQLSDGEVVRYMTGQPGWMAANARPSERWNRPDDPDSRGAWTAAMVIAKHGDPPWGSPGIAGQGGPATYARKEFALSSPVRSARLYVTALGSYRVHINGRRVGEDLWTPDWTDYRQRVTYQTYDVTGYLKSGQNAVGAIIGDGWYGSGLGWNLQRFAFGPPPVRLLLRLHVAFMDGDEQVIASDGSWGVTGSGPILRSELYAGEAYDAGKEMPGWDRPGYTDSSGAWRAADLLDAPGVRITAQRGPTVRVMNELKPAAVSEPSPGVFVFDMGQNMVGFARLKVRGPAGTHIRLRFAEVLNPDGTIYRENLRNAAATDTYTLRGSGTEVWEPHFTFHGFRYVEVMGYPGRPGADAILGRVFHTAAPVIGRLETSSDLVNRIQHNILWGQKGNHISVPTDCPQRDERLGWMGDAQAFARTAFFNMDMAAMYTKWIQDIREAQSPEGGFSDVSPRVVDMADGAPGWGDAGIIVPYELFRAYGDTRILEEHWEAMEKWMEYIHSANPNLLWLNRRNNDFGDWVAAGSTTPKEVIATAIWAYDARLMSEMARALNRPAESEKYAKLFEGIKQAFVRAYVKEDGLVGNGSQTCQVMALYYDLLPAELRQAALKHLVADIERRGNHLSTGFLGTAYLCPVLSDNGRPDVAYTLLLQDTYPSWGYMVRKGATTIWELWNSDTEGPAMNSRNHFAFGSVGQWMYASVAGIDTDPRAPGYRRIVIRPRIDSRLSFAKGELESPYGRITSHWTARPAEPITLSVTIPPNTMAAIYLPVNEKSAVTEAGKPIDSRKGIRFLRLEEGHAVYEVPAGSYRFAIATR